MKQLLIIFGILFINMIAYSETRDITIPETGKYEIKVFVKPAYTTFKKQIVLRPDLHSLETVKVLKDENQRDVYSFEINPEQTVSFDWVVSDNKDFSLIHVSNFSDYYLESNLLSSKISSGLFFYFDSNKDHIENRIVYSGDPFLLFNTIKTEKIILDLKTEKFIPKNFKKKVLHKFNIYKYRNWHYDNLNARIEGLTNGNFVGIFNEGGYIVFQKDISQINILKYPGIGLYTKINNMDIVLDIRIIAKTNGKKVVIKNRLNGNNGFYFFNLLDSVRENGFDVNKLKFKEIIISYSSSDVEVAKIELDKLIFSKMVTKDNANIDYLNENTIENGTFINEFQEDNLEIKDIKTILKNNTDYKQTVLLKGLYLTSDETKQVPVIFTKSFDKLMNSEKIDKLIESNLYVNPVKLWEVKKKGISLDRENIFKYVNKINPIFHTKVNNYFNGQIVVTADITNLLVGSSLYLRIKGERSDNDFEDIYPLYKIDNFKSFSMQKVDDRYQITAQGSFFSTQGSTDGDKIEITLVLNKLPPFDIKLLLPKLEKNFDSLEALSVKTELLYNNTFIGDISLLLNCTQLPPLGTKYPVNINELSINKLVYEKIPNKLSVEGISINLFNDKDRISIPVATLFSKNDFYNGGRWVIAGNAQFNQGKYSIVSNNSDYYTVDDVLLKKSNIIIAPNNKRQANISVDNNNVRKKILKYIAVLLIIALLIITLFVIRRYFLIDRLIAIIDLIMHIKTVFFLIQFLLIVLMLYLFAKYNYVGNVTSPAIIFLIIYSFFVRYYIRPFLVKKWSYFEKNKTAPYFGLAIILLLFTAVILASGNETVAESIAILVYFLLVEGVIIALKEFLSKRIDTF